MAKMNWERARSMERARKYGVPLEPMPPRSQPKKRKRLPPMCKGKTKSGPCKNRAMKGSDMCGPHHDKRKSS
jgi:hypothetical protein